MGHISGFAVTGSAPTSYAEKQHKSTYAEKSTTSHVVMGKYTAKNRAILKTTILCLLGEKK
jgi:hypothetical protein